MKSPAPIIPGDDVAYATYEVYKDEAAFQAHTQAPHFLKFRDTIRDWRAEGPQGEGRGASNIWPPDSQWK
jgi:Antibiotic biosynthesis monooxygenase